MSCNVAFIGLGVMGYPMAGYISKAGHNVTVYNRTAAKADKWITEYKGSKADTPAKAAEGADFIFTCVGNDENLREVSLGENGLFKTAKEGSVYVVFRCTYFRWSSRCRRWNTNCNGWW
jgi:3-hydroxyisobutyrate dehydrogenase